MTKIPIVEAEGLTKRFPRPGTGWRRLRRAGGDQAELVAVDDINLAVWPGEVVGLVGESGSGKSTLGKMLLGLHAKTAGTVCFRGTPLPERYRPADFQRLAGRMQMIFQDAGSALNPRMTVGEIVGEGLALRAARRGPEAQADVLKWLNRVGLDAGHRSRYPHELSGGQRQRVGIARALILEPEFVVCDEPISMLDVSVQAQVVNLLRDLKAARPELAMLFIAHDLSMVRYVSDRIAVMYLGKLVEEGPADRVFWDPRHPYTKQLVRSNLAPNPALARQASTVSQFNTPPPGTAAGSGCRFAPRCVAVTANCWKDAPKLTSVADPGHRDRRVACHHSAPPAADMVGSTNPPSAHPKAP